MKNTLSSWVGSMSNLKEIEGGGECDRTNQLEMADRESAATVKTLDARVKAIEKYLGLAKGEGKK